MRGKMAGMTLNVDEQNGGAIVRMGGRVMYESDSKTFKQLLEEEVEKGGKWIVVDLADVIAMSSTGLGILIAAHRYMAEKEGAFKLAQLSEKVRYILEITRLDTVFEVFDSVENAVAAVQEE